MAAVTAGSCPLETHVCNDVRELGFDSSRVLPKPLLAKCLRIPTGKLVPVLSSASLMFHIQYFGQQQANDELVLWTNSS